MTKFKNICFSLPVFFFLFQCQSPLLQKEKKIDRVTFAVVGDLMLHESQLSAAYQKSCNCYRFQNVFEEVRPYLMAADVAIGNLETTLPGDSGDRKNYTGYPRFGSPDSFIDALTWAGFDILTTANNHSMDKGKAGVLRTIEVLDEKKVIHLGTYKDKESLNKNRALLYEKNGMRFALLNYTYGTNGIPVPQEIEVNLIEKERIARDLQYVQKLSPDVSIVLFHFGSEYLRLPDAFQKEYTQFVFEQGADIVLGGHPHVLQPYEMKTVKDIYGNSKERLVIYSLGNFVSGQQRRYTDGGTIFQFTVEKLKSDGGQNSAAKIGFSEIKDIPVWVYFSDLKKNSGARDIRILPAELYADKETTHRKEIKPKTKLSAGAYKKLLLFYQDTLTHYQDSREKIKFNKQAH